MLPYCMDVAVALGLAAGRLKLVCAEMELLAEADELQILHVAELDSDNPAEY